jgi:Ca2+/Na+ antiporter
MHPVVVTILIIGYVILLLMSLRLGITGAGVFLLLTAGVYLFYSLGKKQGHDEVNPVDPPKPPDRPDPFG